MATEVKAPVLPESVADGTIATWHKKVGDAVKRDENLLDLETDKVVLEVPSPVDGVLKEIKFAEGSTVTSSQVVAIIEKAPCSCCPAPTAEAAPAAAPAPAAAGSGRCRCAGPGRQVGRRCAAAGRPLHRHH
jgi:2-oxoglutarate dehydrogenase E2 component (dihydrolipoamide succinyltransferase)